MIKRALIISPHPDDEINLAGQLLIVMNKYNIESFILYTTNGDSEKKINNKRIYEAIAASKLLGVKEQNVIFLGYPNEWNSNVHIYNEEQEKCMFSKLGKTHTSSISEHPEYCFNKCGTHHEFTRKNFKNDFKEAILCINPNLIICPEFDSHPDHRATSLLFDEIMGELLKENHKFRPIVLKKYIHEGVWNGPKDYYNIPLIPTRTLGARVYSGCMHDLDSPNNKWIERLSFETDGSTKTELLKDNIIYKAAKLHKVTTAWYEMQRVINADVVYWQRPTQNSLMNNASISASSGDIKYINDFKLFDSSDIMITDEPFLNSEIFCWIPDEADQEKTISIELQDKELLTEIRIYEDCNKKNHIKKMEVWIDESMYQCIELEPDGTRTKVLLDKPTEVKKIKFIVLDWVGKPAIAEIELLNMVMEKTTLFPKYNNIPIASKHTVKQSVEKGLMILKFLIVFKANYEMKRIFKKFCKKRKIRQNEQGE